MKDRRALLQFKPWTLAWWRSWPDPLRLGLRTGGWRKQKRVLLAFSVITVGVFVSLIPASYDEKTLGGLTGAASGVNVPALCFLVGDLCLAMGVWTAAMAAQGKPLQRVLTAALGVAVGALAGPCARRVLQVVLLRDFYRPSLFFTSPARAAAVGWAVVLTAAVILGCLAPWALAFANLLPRALANAIRPFRWLSARYWCLLIPFAALALTAIVTQWVLPPTLETAMGYRYPAESGAYLTISLRTLSPVPWYSLQLLVGLPLVVGMWEGVEAARFCHRLVKKPDGISDTRLFARLRRLGYWPVAIAVFSAALALAVIERQIVSLIAGLAIMGVTALALSGVLGPVARASGSFERRVARWGLPEDWREIGPISLALAILALPVVGLLVGDLYRGAEESFRLPWDVGNFYFYWHDYGITGIPSITASEIFAHVEWLVWRGAIALAVLILIGLIGATKADRHSVFRGMWFLCRVGLLALALAPVARLADHSFATPLLGACAVAAFLLVNREYRSAAVWSVVLVAAALSVWSLVLWHAGWIPAAVILGFTIVLRFGVNAGDLNKNEDGRRPYRIAYFQSLALLSVGMLALGHGAAPGYFDTDALSTVTDRVSLSIVAVIWTVLLVNKQLRAESRARASSDEPDGRGAKRLLTATTGGDAGLPASWPWMLNPALGLVAFLGRKQELAVLTGWVTGRDAARVLLVTGPGGSGKTRLAIELCEQGQELGWTSVWVRPGYEAGSIQALHDASITQALIIVDDAETRGDLPRLIAALAAAESDGLRVLLMARSTGEWCRKLRSASPAAHDLVASAMGDQLVLAAAVQPETTDLQIVGHAVTSIAREFGLRESHVKLRRRASQRQNILQLLGAALAATMSDAEVVETGTGTVQVDLLKHLEPLLQHEQEFWHDRARQAGLLEGNDGNIAGVLRRFIAACCLLGAVSVDEAANLGARVAGIPQSPELIEWLRDVCSAGRSWTTPDGILHPSRLAELLTIRELSSGLDKSLNGLQARHALRAVSFLARAAADYKEAPELLSRFLGDLEERIAGEQVPVQTLSAALSVVPDSGNVLASAAIALNRRIVEHVSAEGDPAAWSYWLEELSYRLRKAGHHDDAVQAAEHAVGLRRQLAALSPERHLPSVVLSMENLAQCLQEKGDAPQARSVRMEAVIHGRELVAKDPGLFQPWEARLLAAIASTQGNSDDPGLSVAAAAEAVVLYREAVLVRPGLYEGELGRCLEILSLRYLDSDRIDDSIGVASEAVAIYEGLITSSHERFRPNLARASDNLSVSLGGAGRQTEALAAVRKAVAEYARLQRTKPGQFTTGYAHALGNLSTRYRVLGQAAKAIPPARQRVALYRALAKNDASRYQVELADSLVSLAVVLEHAGEQRDAAAARREAATLSDTEKV